MKLVQHVEPGPDWPEYGIRGDGTPIRLTEVETILPAGEMRANVYFVNSKGFKVWPWKDAGYYVDDNEEPLAAAFDVVPMRREELVALGLDDVKLWAEYHAYFEAGRTSSLAGPDTSIVQVARRKMYDAVTTAWHQNLPRRS